MSNLNLPPGQQLAAPGKWPLVGEREPAPAACPWSLTVTGCVQSSRTWALSELAAMPRTEQYVDIHCVTRWSMLRARFTGVPLSYLLSIVQPTSEARYLSFVAQSTRHHSTSLLLTEAVELGTLVALTYEGQPLPHEHGGPLRSIVPHRYFYKSVKWLVRIELLEHDRLGYWESTAGYHNHADPWAEERFIASSITKQDAARILEGRDIAGRELLGLDASDRDLQGLSAGRALLRNANFSRARLRRASFAGANLSNARFIDADLREVSFSAADLEGADFAGADLRGADLRGASLFGATFGIAEDSLARPARIDSSTRFDVESMMALAPVQAAFISQLLG